MHHASFRVLSHLQGVRWHQRRLYLVRIETTKEYIKFSVVGELGSGSTLLRAKDSEKEEQRVTLDVQEPVNLSFSGRYLNQFSKASTVATQVVLSMSADRPLLL